jgi:acetyl esterase/lipase
MPPLTIDPTLLDPAAIPAETKKLNDEIVARLNAEPVGLTIPEIRARRLQGLGAFPLVPKLPRAETISIDGPAGKLELRVIAPQSPRGVFLHIHGGGWSIGTNDQFDPVLEHFADNCGLACVSLDYRLAPEHPYPAGPDDCEAAALWLVRDGAKRFGTSRFSIGGESAGAHLSVVTLLRLRDKYKLTPFSAAILNYGCYDMSMTPSARRWGDEKLVLNTPAILAFRKSFLPPGTNTSDPDVSPLYADLRNMPAALFTVGTRDALLDDSLFMAPRWLAAGNAAELALYPGACHGFVSIDFAQRTEAVTRIENFLMQYAT